MTWVIGATSIFGYGAIVSDIQVTCGKTERREDVVQKAFPVGKYIAAGFAGDVRVGFALIDSLRDFLSAYGEIPDDECWEPSWVAEQWPKEARRVFRDLSGKSSAGETHILMVGAQPAGGQVLGGAVGHITVFRSPDFQPQCEVGGRKALSIGSGSGIEEYKDKLAYVMQDPDMVYMKGELGNVGGHGRMIGMSLRRTIERNPTPGISTHLHLILVRMGAIEVHTPNGMPPIATNWHDLLQLLDSRMQPESLIASV